MLKIICSLKDMDFHQLMDVYAEGNRENGAEFYPDLSENQQLLQAEQDFYAYLREFFKDKAAFYAVWAPEDRYVAALRMEPYQDGLLLEALETAPEHRRKGYATALVKQTLEALAQDKTWRVYSHVNKKNVASLGVHAACGFKRIAEHAVYADGSVLHNSCTLLCTVGKVTD